MDFKINMNDYVKVKLNDKGIEVLRKNRERLNQRISANGGKGLGEFTLKVDEAGYSKFQLWELIDTFGDLIGIGLEPPFETDMIFVNGKPVLKE